MTGEVWIINGHAPWCSYINSLEYIGDEEPCDCAGWDDDDLDDWDYEVDGDTGTGW